MNRPSLAQLTSTPPWAATAAADDASVVRQQRREAVDQALGQAAQAFHVGTQDRDVARRELVPARSDPDGGLSRLTDVREVEFAACGLLTVRLGNPAIRPGSVDVVQVRRLFQHRAFQHYQLGGGADTEFFGQR